MTASNSARNQPIRPSFTIGLDNIVHASRNPASSAAGLVKFGSEEDLAALAANWPAARLVEIWNKLPRVKRVGKFTDRSTAARRIWKAVVGGEHRSKEDEATRGGTTPSRGNVAGKGKSAGRNSTKTEKILTLLRRPSGATLKEIMSLSGWQSHSVRGFITTHSKKLGLRAQSFKRNGERVYRFRT